MKYILKEIESEEDFIEAFGESPSWVLSPIRLSEPKQKSQETQNSDNKDLAEE
jgi:hypothetical protein